MFFLNNNALWVTLICSCPLYQHFNIFVDLRNHVMNVGVDKKLKYLIHWCLDNQNQLLMAYLLILKLENISQFYLFSLFKKTKWSQFKQTTIRNHSQNVLNYDEEFHKKFKTNFTKYFASTKTSNKLSALGKLLDWLVSWESAQTSDSMVR